LASVHCGADPRSAADPLVGQVRTLELNTQSRTGGSGADQGVRPTKVSFELKRWLVYFNF